jgi:hypothetical protein
MAYQKIRILVILSSLPLLAQTQSYMTAMGLRMGSNFGVSLQQKIIGHLTAEGIVTSTAVTNQTTATALLEMHNSLISKRFNFYVGGGFHQRWQPSDEGSDLNLRGVTAIAGAEMTLGRINIAWDYKPVYHLNASAQPFESETAVSLRYVFVKRGKKQKSKKIFNGSGKKKRQKLRAKKRKKQEKAKNKKRSSQSPKIRLFRKPKT